MRFLLATFGSRGDVHPMLALGRALLRRGHQAIVVGPPDFVADATAAGIDYRPMGRSMEEFLAKNSGAVHGGTLSLARIIKRDIDEEVGYQFELLARLTPDVDCVIAASLVFAARSCAEKLGKPYRFIAFAPEALPSRHHPALGEKRQDLSAWRNRMTWWGARRIDNWLLRRPINRGRAQLGLPPLRDVLAHIADAACTLLATDGELAPAPPDLALVAPASGAMLLDEDGALPKAVESFLAADDPPIYVGFGSMPDPRPEQTWRRITEAVALVGCRAILFTGSNPHVVSDLGPRILVVGKMPHARLFPRTALVVHHGGAGTCARAARAGVPQVLLPHLLDQFPWAARLYRRGLSPPPLHFQALTADALATRIRQGLGDGDMRLRAAALGRALAARDGADEAAAILVGC